jgi:hypothetical protein
MYLFKTKWTSAKKTDYNNFLYDSKFEAGHAAELDLLLKAKQIKSYEKQKTLDLIVNGYIVCTYRIDFIVYHLDGTIEYIEMKGYDTPVWRLKWKLFESLYSELPDVKLTVIYQGKQKRTPMPKKIKKIGYK